MELINIEDYLRQKMIVLVQTKGNLCHPEVVRVSQQLDNFLNQAQHIMSHQQKVMLHA
ncbi:aspartyl-phosphate phosphatase Spo0E family protein [Alicyclobacillus mengziensis]|uniref:Aspartyl-phosphate phosphatase Spo0E family protein n=1 Tax=Alicyclobacillus mengziensis TaxID=2931921 RepID=A0A9X7VZ89_9BACL|nr:aspartyl-phosphate phosphatase Spo0E family protein [Alicyclobacillus mengziensis]QSO47818.1 aspartyl-phosphate phosphatase Spo0E family protein [Alicyclobacillus mengziensis]